MLSLCPGKQWTSWGFSAGTPFFSLPGAVAFKPSWLPSSGDTIQAEAVLCVSMPLRDRDILLSPIKLKTNKQTNRPLKVLVTQSYSL